MTNEMTGEAASDTATGTALVEYSRLRTTTRMKLVDHVPLQAPLAIFIEPSNVCNFKCTYCPESEPDFETISGGWFKRADDQYARILDEIDTLPSRPATINFYMMGEPFVNKALPSMVGAAKRRGSAAKIIVTSNGSLLTADAARRIIDARLDYLRISIYGATEETHRARTASPIKLQRIIDNLKTFRALRGDARAPFLYIKMIATTDPVENALFLERFGLLADEAKLEPVMNWNDIDDKNRTDLDRETLLGTDYFAHWKEVCPFPFYTLVIHSDLRVSVCCVDWSKKAVIGDLRRQSLLDIWRGPLLREFQDLHVQRRRHEIEACRSCTYLHTAPDNLDTLAWNDWQGRSLAVADVAPSLPR